MKKNYQKPEVETLNLTSKISLLDGSDWEVEDIDSNSSKTFDESELSIDANKSGLWDD